MTTLLNKTNSYLKMIKFSHTIFALPLAFISVAIALPRSHFTPVTEHYADFGILLLQIIICMVALRSAAMGFNRLVDRKIDAANPRTSNREIPAGVISSKQATIFILLFLMVFILAAASINTLCALLSPVAIIAVLGYSYTKRFTWLCHFFLGLSIGLAPAGAWVAVMENIELLPLLWSGGLLFYIAGFDILYSCQDAEFDSKTRLHSLPSRFGITTALWIARSSHLVAILLFVWAGFSIQAGWFFYSVMILVSLFFLTEHYMVRPGKLDQIPVAFFNINAVISSLLLVAVLGDLLIRNVIV